jgi:hypothetical protein
MKHVTPAILCLLLALPALAQTVPRIAWSVETSAPAERRLDLRYGETVDLECRMLSYQRAIDLTGASVTLHGRTNGMAEGASWQIAGEARSNGVAFVRLSTVDWAPRSASNLLYSIEATQTNGVRLLRASGTAYVAPSAAASSNEPMPALWFTNIVGQLNAHASRTDNPHAVTAAQVGALGSADLIAATSVLATAASVTLATQGLASASGVLRPSDTNGWTVSAHKAWLTNEVDAVALEALRTNRAYSVWGSDASWWAPTATNIWTRWYSTATNAWVFTVHTDLYYGGSENQTYLTAGSYVIDGMPLPLPATNAVYQIGDFFLVVDRQEGKLAYGTDKWAVTSPDFDAETHEFVLTVEGTGSATLHYVRPATNRTEYYLPTSPFLAESWSYANHTNWMADGEDGQLWVSSLASDSANSVLNNHVGASDPHPSKYAPATATNAPAWLVFTNVVAACTVTNYAERPVRIHGTGAVSVAFSGLREPLPLYLVIRGPSSVYLAGAYQVGGGSYQTNRANHLIVWKYGTNTLVSPVTTTED